MLYITCFNIILHYFVKDLISLLNVIADDWVKPKSEKKLNIMIKHAHNSRVITMFGYMGVILGVSLLVLLPYFGKSLSYATNTTDSTKILPLQFHYLYNKDQNRHFEIKFVLQSFVILIFGICYVGADTLLGLLVFHLCGQLENLTGKLINMNRYDTFSNSLTFIVEDHTRLIKFRNNFDNLPRKMQFRFSKSIITIYNVFQFIDLAIFFQIF